MMPKKKNEKLKVLQGTNRKDREKNNPKPKPLFPHSPPKNMIPKEAKHARKFWKDYAGKLEKLGLAREIDIPAFYTMAMTWETIRQCEELIAKEGILVPGARGQELVKNPAVSVLNAARQQFRLQCQRFGLDPDSREKINIATNDDDDDSFMEFLLKGAENRRKGGDDLG